MVEYFWYSYIGSDEEFESFHFTLGDDRLCITRQYCGFFKP
jgi:hypothetical protein